MLGSDKQLREGREFARVFRRDGEKPLAASQVSRWESGLLTVGHATLRRYEHLLGIAPEQLVTLSDALVRLEGSSPVKSFQVRPNGTHDDLHRLLERAQTPGEMTGADWGHLTELVATQPNLVLHPPALWRHLADQLLAELSLSAFGQWWQRQEAMSRLLEHPHARRYAVEACIALARDQTSPAIIEPISLLEVANQPESNRFILDQIGRPDSPGAFEGALLAAVRKVSHGHFQDEQWTALTGQMIRHLQDSAIDASLLPLMCEVGRLLGRRQPGAVSLHRVVSQLETEAGAAKGSPRAEPVAGDQLVALALGHLDEPPTADGLLPDLIEESLHHPDPERRLVIGMFIGATPYREPVAKALLQSFTRALGARDYSVPLATLRTLTNLDVAIHRPLIHYILTSPGFAGSLRRAAAGALPHCAGRDAMATWRQTLGAARASWEADATELNQAVLDAVVYGIGTDAHAPLLTEVCGQAGLPQSTRRIAAWLLSSPSCESSLPLG